MTEPADRRLLIPVTCTYCGAQQRDADGRTLYLRYDSVTLRWGQARVCHDCGEALETLDALDRLVTPDEGGEAE